MTAYHNRLTALCILLAMILVKRALTSSSECRIEYVSQPPSAPVNCSPYSVSNISNISVVMIALECAVKRQNESTDEFEIRWFRKNMTGGIEELGQGSTEIVCEAIVSSRYHDMDLLNQQYSPSLRGEYWCQVINTTADPDQPLMRSNVFTLLAPGDYSGTTCPTLQALANTTCADLPSNTTVNISTSPLNSVTTSLASISIPPHASVSLSKPVLIPYSTTTADGNCMTITILRRMSRISASTRTQQSTSRLMPSSTTQLPRPPNQENSAIIPITVGIGVVIVFAIAIATITVIIVIKLCLKKKKDEEDDYMTMTNIRAQQSTRSEPNPYDECYFDNTIPESSSITVQTNPSFRENETPPLAPQPPPTPQDDCEETRSQESGGYTNMDSIAKENGKTLHDQQSTEEPEYQNMSTIKRALSSDQDDTSDYQALDVNTREDVSVYTKAARKWKAVSEADSSYGYDTL